MVEIKNPKKITLSSSIPMCPRCSAGMRKIHMQKETIFQCMDCKASYLVKERGQADNELLCEEIQYVK